MILLRVTGTRYKASTLIWQARMAHYISYSLFDGPCYLDNLSNSKANTCTKPRLLKVVYLLYENQCGTPGIWWFIITLGSTSVDASFKFLPHQLWMVGYWSTMALTNNGELGFDSGEGAWEVATKLKEGSRRVNYPILTQGGSNNK